MPEDSKSTAREYIEVPDGIIIDDGGLRVLNDPMGGTYGKSKNPWADHSQVVYENLSGDWKEGENTDLLYRKFC